LVSRAFVKEDVDPPERSGRKRSVSGLPPGATNYITARGAARFEAELARLREMGGEPTRMAALEKILASVQVVDPSDPESKGISFGATVTLRDTDGGTRICTIVGVDELEFEPRGVSWISPLGKALLAAEVGDRVTLDDGRSLKIMQVE
jgi:transcription elongation factor GreB